MSKLFLFSLAALIVCAGVMAQEPQQEPEKKKGGFFKKLAKGVESVTGLDVSKETLFVYPEIGVVSCKLVDAIGNPATNQVKVRIEITKLKGDSTNPNRYPVLEWVKVSGTNTNLPLADKPYPASCKNPYDLVPNKPVIFEFEPIQPIVVPAGTKSIDLMFPVGFDGNTYKIEARDIAIDWASE